MSITFPMWFICLWAVAIVFNIINSIRYKKAIDRMTNQLIELIAPKIVEGLSENLACKVDTILNNRLSDEYIVVKRPTRKVKKKGAEDA